MPSEQPSESTSDDWLSAVLTEAVSRRFCTKIHCTTCVATEFRSAVRRSVEERIDNPALRTMPAPFARVLGRGLAGLRPTPDQTAAFEQPARFLLYELWSLSMLGEVEPMLVDTWAGQVLDRMKAHYAMRCAAQEAEARYNDPTNVQARRDAERQTRQVPHAERLRKQAERAKAWHQEHDRTPPE